MTLSRIKNSKPVTELLSHKEMDLTSLLGSKIIRNKEKDHLLFASTIAAIKTSIERSIRHTYDREIKDDAIIIVDECYSQTPLMSTLIATYFNKWKVYSLMSLAYNTYSFEKYPDNLVFLNKPDWDDFIRTNNGGIFIDNNILFYTIRTSIPSHILEPIIQPKKKACDIFQLNEYYSVNSTCRINNEGYRTEPVNLDVPGFANYRYLSIFDDVELRHP